MSPSKMLRRFSPLQIPPSSFPSVLLASIRTPSHLSHKPSLHPRSRHFTTTSTTMSAHTADTIGFLEAVQSRRTIYTLENTSPISDARIIEIVHAAVKHVPSSFNSQTTRVVVVLNKEHAKLWSIATAALKDVLPEEKFTQASGRLTMFGKAYGTVLFYEDNTTVRKFQDKFKPYEDKFPQWSEQSNGMHQYVIWTALEAEGLGVNLQHYNPLIDPRLQAEYSVPETWSLKAQMVFGKPTAPPAEKVLNNPLTVEERVKVFGGA